MHLTILILLTLGVAVWLWQDTMRAREQARRFAANICGQHGVQFLDQTVALQSTRLSRKSGNLRLARVFGFEFSEEGQLRRPGQAMLAGAVVTRIVLDGNSIGRVIYEPGQRAKQAKDEIAKRDSS